jgi:hypothetical protein
MSQQSDYLGTRLLVCPEPLCQTTVFDAGHSDATCCGQGEDRHEPRRLVAFRREAVTTPEPFAFSFGPGRTIEVTAGMIDAVLRRAAAMTGNGWV